MIVAEGARQVAIRGDEPSAAYVAANAACLDRESSMNAGRPLQVVVEICRALGGIKMRALVGAEFVPSQQGMVTTFEVPFGESLGLGSAANCVSELGPTLVAGLPRDFAEATLDGLVSGSRRNVSMSAGKLRVNRAGFDEVESSETAFCLAAGVLRCVVDAMLRREEVDAAARTAMSGW